MSDFNESPVSIASLEARVKEKSTSPFFARLASALLKEGKTVQAMELCVQGVNAFPHYATGHLVLGRCYEALGRTIEAMLEYRRALKVLPDNPTLQKLMTDIEQHEKEAFTVFAEDRVRKLRDRKDSISVEKYLSEEPYEKETTVEFLLKRLQAAKKGVAPETQEQVSEGGQKPATASSIVTPTLAEIYASQGEYNEAIDAYRKLAVQRPQESERYERRIAQLEQLRKVQQAEEKP